MLALFSFIVLAATFFSALLILKQKPVDLTKKAFIWLIISFSVWILSNSLVDLSIYFPDYTFRLAQATLFGPALMPSLLLIFVLYFTNPKQSLSKLHWFFIFIPSLVFIILIPTSYNIKSVYIESGVISIDPGLIYPFYGAYVALFVLGSFFVLLKRSKAQKGIHRDQIKYVFLGITGTAILGLIFDVFLPLLGISQFVSLGPISTFCFIGFTVYAMVAHQLFDIRIIIKRTVVYSGLILFTLGTYSMIIFFFTALFGGENAFDSKTFIANLLAAMLIAFGADPIRRYLTKVTDKYLFKGEYDPQTVLADLSQKLSSSVDMREASQSLVSLISGQMRLTHAAVVTFNYEESQVVIKEVVQQGYPDPSVLQLTGESYLLKQFTHTPQLIITDLLKRECQIRDPKDPVLESCEHLTVELDCLQVAVAIPILVAQKAIGMFLVGEKLSGDAFTKNEIEFLTIVANQTANAIEKARFWEEDQMKSEFVSIASHELLTPTAAIKGYLSMILDDNMGQIDDRARGFLQKVYSSSDRLAHLVEDLLNVSRIESGRLKINKRDFSLVESVQKAVDELQVNAKAKSLDLALVSPPSQLPSVFADPDHVYRVLVNLIGNSIKYTPQGWVRCFVTQYDQSHLLFAVSDSGLGIPKDAVSHLFEKFYRADRREIAGIQGTGLGLYISKKIIDLMGGQMWVESEVNKGSTFYFTVPVTGSTAAQVQPTATPVASPTSPASGSPTASPVSSAPAKSA